MKIEFTDQQLELLKEILSEYAETSYSDMFEYKKVAVDAEDEYIRKEYNTLADAEEEHFKKAKALSDYVVRYEALMKDV